MQATGRIECQEYYDAFGNVERVEYAWKGGALAYVSNRFVRVGLPVGDILYIGPYRVRILEADNTWPSAEYVVARDGWRAWMLIALYAVTRHLEIVYRRLIITLAVWRLAEYHDGVVPSWRDVYAVQKIMGWLKR